MDESNEGVETMNSEKLGDDNRNSVGLNGSDEGLKGCDDEVSCGEKPKDDPITKLGNSPSSVGATKGKGLRKWRRIKREVIKDGPVSVDSSKAGKRGLSNSAPNPPRGQKSESSLSSTGAVVRNLRNEANGSILFPKVGSVGPADSEISEDQSSISSTAASGSVLRNGGPATVAVVSEKKGVIGAQQGKARVKSKKARGEREKIEKGNSISSSLESDSRSSNFVFVLGTDSVANNGTRNGKVGNHVGENSDDEAQDGEKHIDEVEAGISKENRGELKNLADVTKQSSATELDPLAESIFKLQSAQEALEKEIQKLREVGDESQGITEVDVHEANSSLLFNLRETAEISTHRLKTHVNTLEQNVNVSESKLEEANAALKAKEAMVTKLECEGIEAEIEDLFMQKVEAEFQYLAISRAVEKLKIDLVDRVALSGEIKSTLDGVRDAENNVNVLKTQAEKSEARIEETVETEEVSKLQKRVHQVTSCLFVQLILLFLVFVSFVVHLSPHNAGVVPT